MKITINFEENKPVAFDKNGHKIGYIKEPVFKVGDEVYEIKTGIKWVAYENQFLKQNVPNQKYYCLQCHNDKSGKERRYKLFKTTQLSHYQGETLLMETKYLK